MEVLMKTKDYDMMIQQKVKDSFDLIMPVGVVGAWLSATAIFFSAIPRFFFYTNIFIGGLLLILTLLRKAISIETRIVITICIPVVIGVLSFMDGGFNSAGINLILFSNLLAIMLLSKRKSLTMMASSVIIFLGLWIWTVMNAERLKFSVPTAIWIIQLTIFILFLITMRVIVFSIRKFLMLSIDQLSQSTQRTYQLAYYDQLTGLPNQHLFKKMMLEHIHSSKESGYLIFYKVKNLGIINSVYGEEMGNNVLTEIAAALRAKESISLFSGRIRDNEFAIWRRTDTHDELTQWLADMKSYFTHMLIIPNMGKTIEFYTSYVPYDPDTFNAEECCHKAEVALAYAKRNSQMDVIAYDQTFENTLREEEQLIDLFKKAILYDEFIMHYQKKVHSTTEEVVGVEALARWQSKDLGLVSPGRFIPLTEKLNKTIDFGCLILHHVFRDYPKLVEKYGKEIEVSINIAPSHLMSDGFLSFVEDLMSSYGIGKHHIIFEITEESIIDGVDRVNIILDRLHQLGIRVSMDDFGSGYSSYNHLVELNVDELKIDKGFMEKLLDSSVQQRIHILLESIISISRQLGLKLVAEGVETKEQCDLLSQMGCHVIQGYYFSKPAPVHQL